MPVRRSCLPRRCWSAYGSDAVSHRTRPPEHSMRTHWPHWPATASCRYRQRQRLASLADLAKWTAENYPNVTAVGVDTSPYHDAGATAATGHRFRAATAVEYLRAMTDAGLDIDVAAGQILFRIGLGTHHFLAIAKLRAARQVWSRVVEACGGSRQAQAMRIHARTSNRVLTQRRSVRESAAEYGRRLRGRSGRGRRDHVRAV